MGQEISVIKEAREIVRHLPMDLKVGHLKACADELHEKYGILCVSCTREASINYVAAFTRVLLAIDDIQASTPPSPCGGAMEKPAELELRTGTA